MLKTSELTFEKIMFLKDNNYTRENSRIKKGETWRHAAKRKANFII